MTEEQAFAAFKRQYKGSCTKCSKYGHKGTDCPELRRSDSEEDTKVRTKFRGNCFHCGDKGHKANESDRLLAKHGKHSKIARELEDDDEKFDELYIDEIGL